MLLSRRVWAGLIAALPAVLVSLRFFDVFLYPAAGNNGAWAEDANLLVKLEFLLIFVTALTAWIAGHATIFGRVAAMVVLAAVFGGIVYGLWRYTEGSHVVLGLGLLVAGRFLAGVVAGPGAVAEFTERAVVGLVFYFAILLIVFGLPEISPRRYGISFQHPAAAFCAFYFLLLALVDAAQIYVGTPEAASRRPTVRLAGSAAFEQSSLVIRFAGDAFEIASYSRWRTAGRIVAFFISMGPLGIGLAIFLLGRTTRHSRADPSILPEVLALFLIALGVFLVYQSLRQGASTSILQVRPGGLAVLELTNGKLDTAAELTAAEAGLHVQHRENSYFVLKVSRKAGNETLMLVDSGLADEAAARSLQRLLELYMSGDPSPQGLRKALEADAGLTRLLGPEVIGRLLAASPMSTRDGTIACPGCKTEIAASAERCGYCGLLYPALD
jgi:hypothetical protein